MASSSPARSPSRASASPARSPRLPSPPPFTEVQFGPRSPSIGGGGIAANAASSQVDESTHDADALRRVRPGSKAAEMSSGPPLVPLGDLDSAFQLQEHLKALYFSYTEPVGLDHTVPITKETASLLATPPDGVDRSLWLYELCRLVTKEINSLILAFFNDSPPCSAMTCPEMRASEWQYLCAVHDPPKPCCAIDYCCHTLDWAANILTSTKTFPSRLTLGVEAGGGNANGLRNLQSVCRRLYRIFAHAWYQHRSMFWQVEAQTGLYIFFKTVCDTYQLIEEGNYTVPAEAEGIEGADRGEAPGPTILKKHEDGQEPESAAPAEPGVASLSTNTSRRHKSTLSTGSNFTAVQEEDEDETKAPAEEKTPVDAPLATGLESTTAEPVETPGHAKEEEKTEVDEKASDDGKGKKKDKDKDKDKDQAVTTGGDAAHDGEAKDGPADEVAADDLKDVGEAKAEREKAEAEDKDTSEPAETKVEDGKAA